jgi:bifunctional DNA-binding transcriptional regulator/antitoxin component of YhaV-PrlF toxin-antitoxin module
MGKLVIPCKWEHATSFKGGLAEINYSGCYIDRTGKIVKVAIKKNQEYYDGLYCWYDDTGKFGYVDSTGTVVIPFQWKRATEFNDGFAIVWDDEEKYEGIIDKQGKMITPCKWKYIQGDSNYLGYKIFSEGLAGVGNDNHKYGFIDKTGKLVIPCQWKWVGPFSEGLCWVKDKNGKYGFIDKYGNIVIPCKWKDAKNFSNGKARVQDVNGVRLYINKQGEIIR